MISSTILKYKVLGVLKSFLNLFINRTLTFLFSSLVLVRNISLLLIGVSTKYLDLLKYLIEVLDLSINRFAISLNT